MTRTILPRLQLFEWMDFAWFPACLRRYETDFILYSWKHFAPRKEITEQLSSLMAQSSSRTIVDLCSGSGGLVTEIFDEVRAQSNTDLSLVLTDMYPNLEARFAEGISYWPEPVDARAIDSKLSGVRTMFASLHHFPPEQARDILQDARRCHQPIAVYELTPRSLRSLFLTALNAVFGTLLFTLFLRPFSWRRLLFTYIIPLVPLVFLFDGVVSVFRTYTEKELLVLADSAQKEDQYEWQTGSHRLLAAVVYLHGRPTQVMESSGSDKSEKSEIPEKPAST